MPQKYKVFLLGILTGALSIFMLWLILLTKLSGNTKFAIFLLFVILGVIVQRYALRTIKDPNYKKLSTSIYFLQIARNYQWFGIFLFGLASPYMMSLFVYVVLKNL